MGQQTMKRPNRKTTLRRAYNEYRDKIENLIPFERHNLDAETRYSFLKEKLDQIETEARHMHGFSPMEEYELTHADCIQCHKESLITRVRSIKKIMEGMNKLKVTSKIPEEWKKAGFTKEIIEAILNPISNVETLNDIKELYNNALKEQKK